MSGVVNILLDKDLEGLKLDLDFGIVGRRRRQLPRRRRGRYASFSAAAATSWPAAEYQQAGSDLELLPRARLVRAGIGIFSNARLPRSARPGKPSFRRFPGQPQNVARRNRRANQTSYTGVIFNNMPGATTAMQATASGHGRRAVQHRPTRLAGALHERGRRRRPVDLRRRHDMIPETERSNAMVSMSYDFSGQPARASSMLSFANVARRQYSGGGRGLRLRSASTTASRADNAYLVGNTELGAAVAARFGNGGFFACTNPFTFACRRNGRCARTSRKRSARS